MYDRTNGAELWHIEQSEYKTKWHYKSVGKKMDYAIRDAGSCH